MNKNILFNCVIAVCLIATTFAEEDVDYESKSIFFQKLGAKCRNATGDEHYFLKIVKAMETASDCGTETTKLQQLLNIIYSSISTGNFSGIFKPVCETKDQLYECINTGFNVFNPCFTEEEKSDKAKILKTLKSLFNYVCTDQGNSIALFFEKNGHVCVEEKNRVLSGCFETSLNHYTELPEVLTTSFFINANTCVDIDNIKTCVVSAMAQCSDPTPSNLVNGIFTTALTELSCNPALGKK